MYKLVRASLTLVGAGVLTAGFGAAAHAAGAGDAASAPSRADAASQVWLLDGVGAPVAERTLNLDTELLAPVVGALGALTD